MKLQKEYLLAIFGIIAFLVVGILILVYFKISDVFYFAVGAIIIGIIAAIYYVWKSTIAKKNILWLKASKEKTATEAKEIYLKAEGVLNKISKDVSDMNIDTEQEMLNKARATLISLGCFTARYELIYPKLENLSLSYLQQKKKDVEECVNKIYASLKTKFQEKISAFCKNLNKAIDSAKNVGFEADKFFFDENVKDIDDAIEKTAKLRSKFLEIYNSLYEQVLNLEQIASNRHDTSRQKEKILSVSGNNDFLGLSVFVVIKNELNNLLADDVLKLREALFNIDVESLKNGDILNEEEKKELVSIMNAAKNMNALTIKDIDILETKYKNLLKRAIQKIQTNIISSENFISQQELPAELKELVIEQPAEQHISDEFAEVNISDNVNNIPLNIFASKCFEEIRHKQAIFEKGDMIRRILKNYPVVKDMVEKIIAQKGIVSVNDLKVNYAKEFLICYKFKNPDKADKIKI